MGIQTRVYDYITRRQVTGWLGSADPDRTLNAPTQTALASMRTAIAETDADVEVLRRDVADLTERVTALEQTPPPDPQPEPWPWQSIQAAVIAAEPGAIVRVPAGVYRETVWLGKRLTLDGSAGAVFDGESVREHAVFITTDGVTLQGFEIRNHATPRQKGMVQVQGCNSVVVRDCNLHHTTGACVSIYQATNVELAACDIHHSAYLGVHGWEAHNSRLIGCRIHDNLADDDTLGWEHGGLKISGTNALWVKDCEFGSNDGPAIWADINCTSWLVEHNTLHDNTGPGIFYEVSSGLVASNNRIYNNGHGSPNWAEGAGIRLANTAWCHIHSNVIAWNADGICITQQNRTDWPGHQDVINNTIERNLIAIANPDARQNTLGLAFVWDTDEGQRQWDHSANRVYHAHPAGPWGFGGPDGWGPNTLTWFETFDEGGTWLTPEEAGAALAEAGVPTDWRTT